MQSGNREGSRNKGRMQIGAGDRVGPPIVFIPGWLMLVIDVR